MDSVRVYNTANVSKTWITTIENWLNEWGTKLD